MEVKELFDVPVVIEDNFIMLKKTSGKLNQQQTNEAFTDKWKKVEEIQNRETAARIQREWYLKLYGFDSERQLQQFLQNQKIIFDAGCGLGEKAAWFARLSPQSLVIAMDFSEAAHAAAKAYRNINNLYFVRGDISKSHIRPQSVDYVNCDQVLMHTEVPEVTFNHLASLLSAEGQFACYVYAKKAVPRELLDDYFRKEAHHVTSEQLWEMSVQLAQLGRTLSELKVKFPCPDIPLLNIKGGEYDIQRFLYWNFIKCFWNEELGMEISVAGNFDWYSPSNAKRYSEVEFRAMIEASHLNILYFHKEEACFSGRFKR